MVLENLSNEELVWEEIMKIKTMPISMAHKKELKAKLKVSFMFNTCKTVIIISITTVNIDNSMYLNIYTFFIECRCF